jgi:hypothetical protein
MEPRLIMRLDAPLHQAAGPSTAPQPQFTAQAGVANNAGPVIVTGQMTGNATKREADEKDSSIYDFSTYAEGEDGVRLLIQNGFDKMDLWLVGKRTGPQVLMMHGNSVEAGKAHDVLVEHTNGLIEEWLRFR